MSKIISLICLFLSINISHDVAIAMFKIYNQNNEVYLDIKMDTQDFITSSKIEINQLNKENIYDYLENNLTLHFDEKQVKYSIKTIEFVGDHLNVNAILLSVPSEYTHIKVNNSCLININNHSNIMQFELKNRVRDFRMHLDRQNITVDY